MTNYQKQIDCLVRKMRAWSNRGGRHGRRDIVAQIKKLNKAWHAQQAARLKAFEEQLLLESKRRAEALGKIIEADARRDYEQALIAIGIQP